MIEKDGHFSNLNVHFSRFHPFKIRGSHPLWVPFVWPTELKDHCKYHSSSSMSPIRDIDQDKSRS